MRRSWPAFCLLAALVTFGSALYDPYQIDGDAVSYMDLADLIRGHQWHSVINGYWNPLYPAALALGHIFFHATRYTELRAFYFVNFAIFLVQMAAMVTFTDALLRLRDHRPGAEHASDFLMSPYPMRYLGVALLVLSAQREFSMGKMRPDALLQALLLFAAAALLRHLATNHLRDAALLGLTLGLAYLTKSIALPLTILSLVFLAIFRLLWQKHSPARIAPALLLTSACFAALAGPYIAALSHQKGRFDFSDSGSLNQAWFVSGTAKMHLEPDQPLRFGVAEVHLKHPEAELLHTPAIFSYKSIPYGTYPDWFDPSFWNDRITPHINPRLQLLALLQSSVRLLRYFANHPEGWILLVVLVLSKARFYLNPRTSANAFWLVPVALGAILVLLYASICIEDRYISFGITIILLALFAALTGEHPQSILSPALVLLLSLLALGQSASHVGELRRNLAVLHSPGGWYDPDIFPAARALNALGIGTGDTVACIGAVACLQDQYWARLAGVRVLTEVYEPTTDLYPAVAAMPNRDQVLNLVRRQGDKFLIGAFDPGQMTGATPTSAGWQRLANTHFYALPLSAGWRREAREESKQR